MKKSPFAFFEKTALVFTLLITLCHPVRFSILEYLNKNGQSTVMQIYEALELEQAIASQHLARMKKHGIVKSLRKGHHVFYSINFVNLRKIILVIEKYFSTESINSKPNLIL